MPHFQCNYENKGSKFFCRRQTIQSSLSYSCLHLSPFIFDNCVCLGGVCSTEGIKCILMDKHALLFFSPCSWNCSGVQQPSPLWIINAPGFVCPAGLSLGRVDSGDIESPGCWRGDAGHHTSDLQSSLTFRGCRLTGRNISSVIERDNCNESAAAPVTEAMQRGR